MLHTPCIRRLTCGFIAGLVATTAHAADLASRQNPAASFTVPACTFDRGNENVRVDLVGRSVWSDTAAVLHSKIHAPTFVEYDIDFPVTAEYALSIHFAAAEARPVEVLLDGRRLATGCRDTSGGWNATHAKWEATCTLHVPHNVRTQQMRLGSSRFACLLQFEF